MRSCVVDTMVLQKSNAPLENTPRANRQFSKRVELLASVVSGEQRLLYSAKLIQEYSRQVAEPRNDFVRLFLQLLTDGGNAVANWPKWPSGIRDKMFRCRFPAEDEHVLRTAWLPGERSTLYTEEGRMLNCRACILRTFGVDTENPAAKRG
jgi:hypothetical protein